MFHILFFSLISVATVLGQDSCKCYEGDSCWPAEADWAALNDTVGGALQAALPPGRFCYESFDETPTYNAQQCGTAVDNLVDADWIVENPTAVMWPFYTNNTCDPKQGVSSDICTQGYRPDYVIVATNEEQIQAGVNFARDHSIRLIVQNTGHDFMGRSTGYGGLTINTHRLDSIEFMDSYTGPGDWAGSAVSLGAGVMVHNLYDACFEQNVVVVSGECPTVGMVGGYIQGGGQGPMAGIYGLAADNALSFRVVTADGELVTADAESNSDLFWALKGGGPGTFGVVTHAIVKSFPEVPSVSMTMTISGTGDSFWNAATEFHNSAPTFANEGIYVWFSLMNNYLIAQPFVAPNMTRADFEGIVNPFLDSLSSTGAEFTNQIQEWPTFYELYTNTFGDAHNAGGQQALTGGRLITIDDVEQNGDAIVAAFRGIVDQGAAIGGHILNPGHANPTVDNAAHPAWRNSASSDLFIVQVDAENTLAERRAAAERVTSIGQPLRDATPNSGGYVNEGDINEPNWQEAYWGDNYPRLLEIKRAYDPDGVFYTKTTPGSEDWTVSDNGDGRLCRV